MQSSSRDYFHMIQQLKKGRIIRNKQEHTHTLYIYILLRIPHLVRDQDYTPYSQSFLFHSGRSLSDIESSMYVEVLLFSIRQVRRMKELSEYKFNKQPNTHIQVVIPSLLPKLLQHLLKRNTKRLLIHTFITSIRTCASGQRTGSRNVPAAMRFVIDGTVGLRAFC